MPEPTPEEIAEQERLQKERIRSRERYRRLKAGENLSPPFERVCQTCGKPFTAMRPNAKFCGPNCRENLLKLYSSAADETIIDQVLRHGTASISERYLSAIQTTVREYVAGIFRRLREHEYDPELIKLYVVGGGGCLVKNFGEFEAGRVIINDDICATAKGYEYLAHLRVRKGGTV